MQRELQQYKQQADYILDLCFLSYAFCPSVSVRFASGALQPPASLVCGLGGPAMKYFCCGSITGEPCRLSRSHPGGKCTIKKAPGLPGVCRVCNERRCRNHCRCKRDGTATGRNNGRGSSPRRPLVEAQPQAQVEPRPPAPQRLQQPQPPPPTAASTTAPSAATTASSATASAASATSVPLRMAAAAFADRQRKQFRFIPSQAERLVEETWGYGRRVTTWGEALQTAKTTWWLAKLQAGEVWSERLRLFLAWADAERLRTQQHRPRPQPQLQPAPQPRPAALQPQPEAQWPRCSICRVEPPAMAVVPCWHLCLCLACSDGLALRDDRRCPICRAEYDRFQRVFA